jgi:hypothetical protein
MPVTEGNVWKLSYAELAQLCQQFGHNNGADFDPQVREEARRLYASWTDALAINLHQEGAAERQASIILGLRKRTIELFFKSGLTVE